MFRALALYCCSSNMDLSLVDIPSHLDDLPPTMLKKDYASIPVINRYDTVKA